MKRLALLLIAAIPALAQVPYKSVQGNLTLVVMDWSNQNPLNLLGSIHNAAPVKGIMISACTTDHSTQVMHSIIKFKNADGSAAMRVDDLGPLSNVGWAMCATTTVPVPRDQISTLTVQQWAPTAVQEFQLPQ